MLGLIIIILFIISGCNQPSSDEEQTSIIKEPIETESKLDIEITKEKVEEVHHIHGLTFHPNDNDNLLIATHYGVIQYAGDGQAYVLGEMRDDFMGFSRVATTGNLMSSGHPGHESPLPDPLGFMWSNDYAQTWELRSLLGEYDFHALTASYQDSNHIVGYALDFANNFSAYLFQTKDQGYTWENMDVNGLPLEHHGLLDLAFSPTSDQVMYAATVNGLYVSMDGGFNWDLKIAGTVSALAVLNNTEVLFYNETEEELVYLKEGEEIVLEYNPIYGAINYIALADGLSTNKMAVSTTKSSILVSNNLGEEWNIIVEEGKVK